MCLRKEILPKVIPKEKVLKRAMIDNENGFKEKPYKDVIIKILQSSFSFMKCPQAMFLF